MKNVRLERINSEIRKAISEIIDQELRDPQINAMIGVSSVEITPDLANAKVFITCMGETPEDEVIARIKGAAGFIRGELSKRIKLRITPRLDFRLDKSEQYFSHINEVLKNITYTTKADDEDEE